MSQCTGGSREGPNCCHGKHHLCWPAGWQVSHLYAVYGSFPVSPSGIQVEQTRRLLCFYFLWRPHSDTRLKMWDWRLSEERIWCFLLSFIHVHKFTHLCNISSSPPSIHVYNSVDTAVHCLLTLVNPDSSSVLCLKHLLCFLFAGLNNGKVALYQRKSGGEGTLKTPAALMWGFTVEE